MKRYSIIICLLCVLLCFGGCRKSIENETTTFFATGITESSAANTDFTGESERVTFEETTNPVTTADEITKEETTTSVSEIQASTTDSTTKPLIATEESRKESICTIDIDCKTILDNKDDLKSKTEKNVPSDGMILSGISLEIREGDTVLDVLLKACSDNECSSGCESCKNTGIRVDYTDMPMFNSCYIDGIHGIYEKDCGGASGWMYSVNGKFPQVGANAYTVEEGDKIVFIYTCDGGADVGDR